MEWACEPPMCALYCCVCALPVMAPFLTEWAGGGGGGVLLDPKLGINCETHKVSGNGQPVKV